MPTKSEIESRVSRIIQIFKSAMPGIPAPYPSITIATQRTYRDTRALLVSQTGSAAVAAPTDEWVVELISGEKGSAILVQKEQVKRPDAAQADPLRRSGRRRKPFRSGSHASVPN